MSGSGTAIGVAVMFPMLMLVIVALQAITSATRTEQMLQAAVDRAAHSASMCCELAQDAIAMAESAISLAGRRLCTNDVVDDSTISIVDAENNSLESLLPTQDEIAAMRFAQWYLYVTYGGAQSQTVPVGGQVRVAMSCRLRPSQLGVTALPDAVVERRVVGVATIGPFHWRAEQSGA